MGLTYIQPDASLEVPEEDRIKKWSYKVAGSTQDVIDYCQGVKHTTVVPYGYIKSYTIDRKEGDLAIGTLYAIITEPGGGGTPEDPEPPLYDRWKLGNTRIEIPIEAFCGPSLGADALLNLINLWREETNADLYNDYKYLDQSSGEQISIGGDGIGNSKTVRMAEMIRSGVQVVPKYYPLVTHTREYAISQPSPTGKLGYIDSPAEFSSTAAAWVKVAEDIEETDTGTWLISESWQGADKAYSELYSDNPSTRWKIGGTTA